ncbi:dihydroxyacetone kinase family protein [Rhizobium halophytocola]|uniref:Dihydroxyacetone kinase n=1 Tax=Rhizobium halophytocola TaxID=735519 RepID=A0ABS4E0T5_9HYPH|nr:dihydroxyacetone kinase family protein [Rhizobium halophytocola]MBP1851536.1 dihydroxyacetone kinase [Rhizobium halophytocola]
MTKILDDAESFASAALAGFSKAYGRYVHLVAGGVVRATQVPDGKVSVIVGGGSGHYPAFAGYVGPGLADAAVAGEIFASPSTAGIARVCRRASHGGGILLGFGNYAGDVLNFGVAAERLRAEGIDVRIVEVTDDVASAPADQHEKRRGIAGDFPVFKIAGAAAEAGLALDAVERIARHANDSTRSFGVAFGGCTLPGAGEPLFTVPKGRMALGLGIHGEPGIEERDLATATELATLLVDTLLREKPENRTRAAVLLNGLGATKYEELFVLWDAIETKLRAEGIEMIGAEVGELVTSLDMQGCSLTLTWLDDELERYWLAPCDTPAFRRGDIIATTAAPSVAGQHDEAIDYPPASAVSRKDAACLAGLFEAIAQALGDAESALGAMDALAGDGDHGQGMRRGVNAARTAIDLAVQGGAGAATALAVAGDAWADRAGGTSGAIWGLLLRSWSRWLSDDTGIDSHAVARGARAALDDVMRLGGARPGDKTLVDAFLPFVETLEGAIAAQQSLPAAWNAAAAASHKAAEATAPLAPRLGRARPLAQRSIGHPDPGATSLALVAQTIGKRLDG